MWDMLAPLTMKLMVEARLLGATQIIGGEVDCIRFLGPLRVGSKYSSAAPLATLYPPKLDPVAYVREGALGRGKTPSGASSSVTCDAAPGPTDSAPPTTS